MYVLWDGSSPWVDDDAMTKSLREINRRVKLVAFGERSDSQFIVYDNWVLALSKCPCVIEEYWDEKGDKADLDCVSLGPDDEYYMIAEELRIKTVLLV